MTVNVKLANTPFFTDSSKDATFRLNKLYCTSTTANSTNGDITNYLFKVVKVTKTTVKIKIFGEYVGNPCTCKTDCTFYDLSDAKDVTLKVREVCPYTNGCKTAEYNGIMFAPFIATVRNWYDLTEYNEEECNRSKSELQKKLQKMQ